MSLRDDIMALRPSKHAEPAGLLPAYKRGHQSARHAAAELAQQADAELARLRTECERLRAALCAIAEHDADCGMIGWVHWKAMARAALSPGAVT